MLTKFEGEFTWQGQTIVAAYDGTTLTLRCPNDTDLLPAVALEMFNRLAKLGAKRGKPQAAKAPVAMKPKKERLPKPEKATPSVVVTATAGVLVQSPLPEQATNGSSNVHHLPTPTKTQAIEVETPQEIPRGRIDGPPVEPFLEDLDVHKAIDQAARVQVGKEAVPPELVEATGLKTIIVYLQDKHNLNTLSEVQEVCEAWQPSIPYLKKMGVGMKKRLEETAKSIGFVSN